MSNELNHGCRSAEVIQVIRTVATRGDGKDTVFREVTSYWSLNGELLAELDPCIAWSINNEEETNDSTRSG
jgi:hypothetical protein